MTKLIQLVLSAILLTAPSNALLKRKDQKTAKSEMHTNNEEESQRQRRAQVGKYNIVNGDFEFEFIPRPLNPPKEPKQESPEESKPEELTEDDVEFWEQYINGVVSSSFSPSPTMMPSDVPSAVPSAAPTDICIVDVSFWLDCFADLFE
jgi:hypothetical protein